MKTNISIINIIAMMYVLSLYPTILMSDNPEWMYFPDLEDIRGMEAIDNYIYLGLAWPKIGIIRLNLETLKLDTIDPAMVAESFKQDTKGNVWIGTPRGLWEARDKIIINKYDHTNSNLKRFFNGPDLNILSIAIDKYDNKWIATDTGLVKFDGIEGKYFAHRNPKLGIRYTELLLDNDGESVWILVPGSMPDVPFPPKPTDIMRFNNGEFSIYDTSNTDIDNISFRGIANDTDDNIWLATLHFKSIPNSGRLVRYNRQTWEHFDSEPFSLTEFDMWCIGIEKEGPKWIGTRKGGLVKYDGNTWTQFNTDNSDISGNQILKIIIDKYGNKWIVVAGSGINGSPALEVFREGGVLFPTNVQEYVREQESKVPIVYPNPAHDIIKVTDLFKRERTFKISNLYGQTVLEGVFDHEIDISKLISGFYFLKVDEFNLRFIKK